MHPPGDLRSVRVKHGVELHLRNLLQNVCYQSSFISLIFEVFLFLSFIFYLFSLSGPFSSTRSKVVRKDQDCDRKTLMITLITSIIITEHN